MQHTSKSWTKKLTHRVPQLTFAFQLVYILALSLVKSSILCFYRRVFVSTRLRLVTNIMFGVVAVWGLSHSMAVIFVCTPVSFQWDLTIKGKCGDQIKLFQSLITTNILTDAMIMLIPVYSTSLGYPSILSQLSNQRNSCVAFANAKDRKGRSDCMLPHRNRVSSNLYIEPRGPSLTSTVSLPPLSLA
jgi:hypothetical protein